MDRIISVCQNYKVTLIEDAAESLGSLYNGKHPGTFGDYGIYSFNGNKIITTSGGGMLISKHNYALKKVRKWASQSRDNARHYEHSELGYNYRMSNVVAGIGRGQLKVLNQRVQKKKTIYDYYQNHLGTVSDVSFMPNNVFDSPNYWLSCVLINGKVKPTDIIEELEKENIESRPLWKPMHLQPYFKEYDFIGGNVAEDLFNRGLCLPSDTKLTIDQLNEIIEIVKKTIG
jgi:dTDP-4-amino-4,6-dideoxygalactose transaminase